MEVNKNSSAENKGKDKRPYEPPQVVSEEVFETLALSCAQFPLACIPGVPKS